MCYEDWMVVRGRFRGRLTTLAAAVMVVPGLAACGDDGPAQTTAPAETGASESGEIADPGGAGEESEAHGEAPERDPDEPSANPAEDQAEITATLESLLAGSDPALTCGELVTDRFLRRSYGDQAGCEAALKAAKPAKAAGVTHVSVQDDSVAQALARPDGGIYDGQKLRAELVLADGTWKLDSLRSNVPVGP